MSEERWGRGPRPALLLHGFTHRAAAWRRFEATWGAQLSVWAPELPGPSLDGQVPESFEGVVDALAETARRIWKGRPFAVIGYSQGARLGLALALRHPSQVERLVVESGSPGIGELAQRRIRAAEDEARARRIESVGVEAFIREWEALPLFAGIRELPASKQQTLRALRQKHEASELTRALRVLGQGSQPDYAEALGRLRPPALFIAGRRDPKYRRWAEWMSSRAPLGRRLVFDCGHAPHLEVPAYAEAVLDFLRSPVLGGTS